MRLLREYLKTKNGLIKSLSLLEPLNSLLPLLFCPCILIYNTFFSLSCIRIGVILCVMTFITVDLMERLGRRTLHVIIGMTGMLIFSAILNTTLAIENFNSDSNSTSAECRPYSDNSGTESVKLSATGIIVVLSTLGFVIVFGVGPGAIPWLIPAEMFGQAPRAAASSFSIFCNWMAQLMVALLFPQIQKSMGNYSLIPFAILLFILWIILFIYFPETKNQSAAQVSLLLQIPNGWRKPIGIRSAELMNALNNGRTLKDIEHFSFTGSVY